ncbi:STN domain-containing protein, partial [Paracidovorax cattleyae]|uniref:STN domain-containing protein n=1 Tax=Paracidovorax cattleyae TaxID=80868 RepID=UPI000D2030D1
MRDSMRSGPRGGLPPLALSLTLALAALSPAVHAQPDASAVVQAYDIPPGALGPALNRFAQEAGVSLAVDAGRVAGATTAGLQGRYSVEEGFAQLLKGSGYAIRKTGAGYGLAPALPATVPPAGERDRTGARADP